MKILLIYPEIPITFWSFKYALSFIGKKASDPPLGLLTVASLLPSLWEKKLVDLNTRRLTLKDILWADFVFISGMDIQKESFTEVVKRCKDAGAKIVAGGPMVTQSPGNFPDVDCFMLNEAEMTMKPFVRDLESGHLKKVYETGDFADLSQTPCPDWSLLHINDYASMDLQYSRGCPFNCEFCSITALFGHKSRVKKTDQFLDEMTSLYKAKWRGSVFIVDDNFIGNKNRLKSEMLPALISWQEDHHYPFNFTTEASINMSDDEELMDMMRQAGFSTCFIGIESSEEASLNECHKIQNQGRDLIQSVKIMQRKGFNVSGGFIIGFDNDPVDIFDRQTRFIQNSGIVTAMVGLLNAPLGTRLYERLKKEKRIIAGITGNNTDGILNFIPKIPPDVLINGYKSLMKKIYSPKLFFERIRVFLEEYRGPFENLNASPFSSLRSFVLVLLKLGVLKKDGKFYFWKLFWYTLFNYPEKLRMALTFAVYGYHFQRVAESI